MRTFKGTLVIGISVVLLALGLGRSDRVHCSGLDPAHPVALSNYFDARGFPFAWLATALLRSFTFWVIVTTVGGFLLRRRD